MLAIYISMLETEQERTKMTELYEANKNTCLHVALNILKSQDLAEDAVHNAFVEVIKNKDRYFQLSGRDFRSLIVVIVKNKSIDIIRKRKKISETPIDDMEYQLDSMEMPIEMQIINKEEYENLIRELSQLNEIDKQILVMKYVLDMSYKEIANSLGVLEKNVDMRIYRAKLKYRKRFGKKEESDGKSVI